MTFSSYQIYPQGCHLFQSKNYGSIKGKIAKGGAIMPPPPAPRNYGKCLLLGTL